MQNFIEELNDVLKKHSISFCGYVKIREGFNPLDIADEVKITMAGINGKTITDKSGKFLVNAATGEK